MFVGSSRYHLLAMFRRGPVRRYSLLDRRRPTNYVGVQNSLLDDRDHRLPWI